MSKLKGERRYDRYGEFRLMAEAEGYVLFRRKGGMTYAMTRKEWDTLAKSPDEVKRLSPEVRGAAGRAWVLQ